MKVKDIAGGAKAPEPARDIPADGTPRESFSSVAKGVEDRGVEARLRAMAASISAQGEKLAGKVDIRELRVYRKMISDFMEEAVGNSRKFSKQSFLDRRGRHKVYALIKKVNGELDDLAREVLSEEKDRIKILKKLDEIRGLILDILM
ncbi:MAG: YaaR family protein [Clostridiales bacterium]|jgi:uncharacterized protein YaaR (DUF327 family)|nr:YaaR family protein [Clostridiales bacterium]